MFRYRTEIIVPEDRYVWLKLPDDAPLGPAVVSVLFQDAESDRRRVPTNSTDDSDPVTAEEPDHDDIEWWEEFEEDAERD